MSLFPQAMDWKDCISMLPASDGTFRIGDIDFFLPVFWRQENFSVLMSSNLPTRARTNNKAINDVLYGRIKPAVVLASIWAHLAEPAFIRILFASMVGLDRKKPHRFPYFGLDPHYAITDRDRQKYRDYVATMNPALRFFLARFELSAARSVWGDTRATRPFRKLEVNARIDGSFYDFFAHPRYDEILPELKARNLFKLANTLIHELGHAMYDMRLLLCWRGAPYTLQGKKPNLRVREAWFHPAHEFGYWDRREMGTAVEYFLFGGSLDALPSQDPLPMDRLMRAPGFVSNMGIACLYRRPVLTRQIRDGAQPTIIPEAVIWAAFDIKTWVAFLAHVKQEEAEAAAVLGGTIDLVSRIELLMHRKMISRFASQRYTVEEHEEQDLFLCGQKLMALFVDPTRLNIVFQDLTEVHESLQVREEEKKSRTRATIEKLGKKAEPLARLWDKVRLHLKRLKQTS